MACHTTLSPQNTPNATPNTSHRQGEKTGKVKRLMALRNIARRGKKWVRKAGKDLTKRGQEKHEQGLREGNEKRLEGRGKNPRIKWFRQAGHAAPKCEWERA
ncbi:MAG: hypothetical protein E6Q61_05505 [Nitrosomonas sp.]|nr:MAG: hypothetical protein E6Q61_05505 [Nitrosomonas sp.]